MVKKQKDRRRSRYGDKAPYGYSIQFQRWYAARRNNAPEHVLRDLAWQHMMYCFGRQGAEAMTDMASGRIAFSRDKDYR